MFEIKKIEAIVKNVSKDYLQPFIEQTRVSSKQDGSLITEADVAVQHAIKLELEKQFPGTPFFAEELSDAEMQVFFAQNHQGYWCLDPIDGTSNFASSLPFFAISLALITQQDNEQKTIMGLVYDPMRDECFTAIKGQGAFINGKLIKRIDHPGSLKDCIAMVDMKRLPKPLAVKLVTEPCFRSMRSFGAAALEWCWLAMGRCDIYLHGKHMLWDYAAGLLIAEESGCITCDINGEQIFMPSLQAKKVVAATTETLHQQWFKYIAAAT
jgi:myo-inositol-1(or 4)-monophosphatase